MKKLKTALILLIVIGAIGFIAGALIAMFTSEDELSFAQSLTSSSAFIGLGIGAALGFIIGIFPKKQQRPTKMLVQQQKERKLTSISTLNLLHQSDLETTQNLSLPLGTHCQA